MTGKIYKATLEFYTDKTERSAREAFPIIKGVYEDKNNQFERIVVPFTDGTKESFYIPLRMMSFVKENPSRSDGTALKWTILEDWTWGDPNYTFWLPTDSKTVKKITIDPSGFMADVKKDNNVYELK